MIEGGGSGCTGDVWRPAHEDQELDGPQRVFHAGKGKVVMPAHRGGVDGIYGDQIGEKAVRNVGRHLDEIVNGGTVYDTSRDT
ncbi:MAG: hypothetical protein WBO77_02515 [Microgenomates group bacterium]